jgi:NMD protein affecting ribosome stability and mRNA decay
LDKQIFYVLSVHANKLKLIDISTWNETVFDIKSMKKTKTIGNKELVKEMIIVNQKDNEVQVMDEKSYEIKIVKKPKPINFKSEKIKTVEIDESIYLLPK